MRGNGHPRGTEDRLAMCQSPSTNRGLDTQESIIFSSHVGSSLAFAEMYIIVQVGRKDTGRWRMKRVGCSFRHSEPVHSYVVWTGSGGRIFFQNEFSYDVDSRFGHHNRGGRHWKGKGTFTHTAYALGTYAYYRDHPVVTPAGIQISPAHKTKSTDVRIINGFSVFLNGQSPAGVGSVVAIVREDGTLATKGEGSLGKDQRKRVSEHVLHYQPPPVPK